MDLHLLVDKFSGKGLSPSERKRLKSQSIDELFGHPPGVKIGETWATRMDCLRAGVHRATRAGIHGSQIHGTYSIVISGGYQDDYDKGETIIYTGAGGQDERTHMQTSDQRLDHPHNAALVKSLEFGHRRKVRVIRGSKLGSKFAPGTIDGPTVYRYDGLYTVTHFEQRKGIHGFDIFVFELKRCEGQPPLPLYGAKYENIETDNIDAGAESEPEPENVQRENINAKTESSPEPEEQRNGSERGDADKDTRRRVISTVQLRRRWRLSRIRRASVQASGKLPHRKAKVYHSMFIRDDAPPERRESLSQPPSGPQVSAVQPSSDDHNGAERGTSGELDTSPITGAFPMRAEGVIHPDTAAGPQVIEENIDVKMDGSEASEPQEARLNEATSAAETPVVVDHVESPVVAAGPQAACGTSPEMLKQDVVVTEGFSRELTDEESKDVDMDLDDVQDDIKPMKVASSEPESGEHGGGALNRAYGSTEDKVEVVDAKASEGVVVDLTVGDIKEEIVDLTKEEQAYDDMIIDLTEPAGSSFYNPVDLDFTPLIVDLTEADECKNEAECALAPVFVGRDSGTSCKSEAVVGITIDITL